MNITPPRILLIGYGNPSRLDDGLGPALAELIENADYEGVTVDSDYQLSIESALDVSQHDIVIFADAAVTGDGPYYFKEIMSRSPQNISTHQSSPEAVLYFAETMFHSRAKAYVLGIRGYEFSGFGESLSVAAKQNMEKAFIFLKKLVTTNNVSAFADANKDNCIF